jgi:hypothetical protein
VQACLLPGNCDLSEQNCDNDSNQDVRVPSSGYPHEYFIELCALSITDSLTAEERRQLGQHLTVCGDRRKIKAQYDTIIATTLSALAADCTRPEDDSTPNISSIEQAESSLMAGLTGRISSPKIASDSCGKLPMAPILISKDNL